MSRQLIAITTAAALALSSFTAVPAEAKSKDALKLLLGAAAVGLLLNQLSKNQAQAVTRRPDPKREEDDFYYDDDYRRTAAHQTIPSECLMDVTVNGRLREVVSSRCAREFGLAQQLPAECAFDVRTSAGSRSVYGPQCLRDYGYRVEVARY